MANFNFGDVDFDLNNLRAEEDMWNRMIKVNNDLGFNEQQNQGLPIDGDALIASRDDEKVTKTIFDLYNQWEKKDIV